MTATAINEATRQAIDEGYKVWTQAVTVGRNAPAALVEWEIERAEQDLYRAVGIEMLMAREEIEARYRFAQDGPFSMEWEEDEDGEQARVPLERAAAYGYHLRITPRRKPLPGAVYVARQPIEGDVLSIPVLVRAFRAVEEAHGGPPQEVRLSHRDFTDYLNLLTGERRFFIDGETVTVNGVPVKPQPRAPLMTLLAVYPLPEAGG